MALSEGQSDAEAEAFAGSCLYRWRLLATQPEPVASDLTPAQLGSGDVVVTVPKAGWQDWIEEGDLPGTEAEYESHFFIWPAALPNMQPGDRVYIVAHDRVRGYAPLVTIEKSCELRPERACLVREGGAEAVTIAESVRGFQGWRYRWWHRGAEQPFPDWQTAGVTGRQPVKAEELYA